MPKRLDITNELYGDFKVIEMLYGYKFCNGKPRTYCRCLGKDNNEYIIRADALRSGATTSIKGVEHKVIAKDISNQKFGHLLALYPTDKRAPNGGIIWHCKCDCGNEIDVQLGNLTRGHTRSCGCNKQSKWEEFIKEYLKSHNISFVEQKRFDDCRNSKGTDMLPFDFYINDNNSIIEYDGEHHFNPVPGWGGLEKFKTTQENDNIKNQYCLQHNINLLRIPYTDTEEEIIEKINLFLSPATITVA